MHVSFRNRLTFFFIVLVILPVIAVAAVGILIVHDSENSKNETSLDRARVAAEALYTDASDRAMAVAETVQTDDRLAVAVRDGDRAAQQDRLEALTERTGAVRVRLVLDGQEPVEAGEGEAIAPVRSRVVDANGKPAGGAGPLGDATGRVREPVGARNGLRRRPQSGRRVGVRQPGGGAG